jgi:hypothetical protein
MLCNCVLLFVIKGYTCVCEKHGFTKIVSCTGLLCRKLSVNWNQWITLTILYLKLSK